MNDQHFVAAAAYTTHNKHKKLTPMPSAGLEPPITLALDLNAPGIRPSKGQVLTFLTLQPQTLVRAP